MVFIYIGRMLSELVVIHKLHPVNGDLAKVAQEGPVFQTCLRMVQLRWVNETDEVNVPESFHLLRGEMAYQFVLEVICGLHSPVVGETEVFGQFKAFRQQNEFSYPLNTVLDNLITDTKKIRGQHLTDLGGQSYGSIIRKYVRPYQSVAFIGAGAFSEELLPWVYKEDKAVTICARNVGKAQNLLERYPRLTISDLSKEEVHADVVIVAAPVTSETISRVVKDRNSLVIDLRGESRFDLCQSFPNYYHLDQIFSMIESNQKQILNTKAKALKLIDSLTVKRGKVEVMRPFGWEDICVW